MVKSILEGRKTMTRRVCRHQHWSHQELVDVNVNGITRKVDRNVSCKYGDVGDLLWVKETFTKLPIEGYVYKADMTAESEAIRQEYKKTGVAWANWTPSIFMPRMASRITLEIVKIRVERLNQITHEDAIREGVEIVRERNPLPIVYPLLISGNGPAGKRRPATN